MSGYEHKPSLPSNEQQQRVVGDDQRQHRARKQERNAKNRSTSARGPGGGKPLTRVEFESTYTPHLDEDHRPTSNA
jgi:hypothetical protein